MKITELSLMALTEALQKKEVSAQEAAEAYSGQDCNNGS